MSAVIRKELPPIPPIALTPAEEAAERERRERTPTRLDLLSDLQRQLPRVSDRGRERTLRAIQRLEVELAPGRGAESDALRRLDARVNPGGRA